MIEIRRLTLALGIALIPVIACAQTDVEVAAFTGEYFHAFSRGEASNVAARSYAPLLDRMGSDPTSTLSTILDGMKAHGTLPYAFAIDRITSFEGTDHHKIFLIELTTLTESFPSPIRQAKLWAAIPDKTGSLKMLSLDCISVPWIEDAAHGFAESPVAALMIKKGILRKN